MKLRLNDNRIYLSIVILLVVIDTGLNFINKYSYNDLSFQDFNLFLIGNILGVLLFLSSLIGIILKILLNNTSNKIKIYCLFLIILAVALNVAATILNKWQLFASEEYFFDFPANKLSVSFLILLKTFVQLYFISFVWMAIIRSDSWNILRAFVTTIVILLAMNLFSFLYIQKDTETASQISDRDKTAVVLGAAVYKNNRPSPLFEARIKKAFELYETSIVKKILATGSNAPGEITEAQAAFQYLVRMGIRKSDIIIEENSRTTMDQIRYLKKNYNSQQGKEELIIISDKFHLARISEICKFMGVEFESSASDYIVGDEKLLFYQARESISLLVFWLFGT